MIFNLFLLPYSMEAIIFMLKFTLFIIIFSLFVITSCFNDVDRCKQCKENIPSYLIMAQSDCKNSLHGYSTFNECVTGQFEYYLAVFYTDCRSIECK
jgi:hypothetical protein